MSILLIPNLDGTGMSQTANLSETKAAFWITDYQDDLAHDPARKERVAYPHLSAGGEAVVRYAFDADGDDFSAFQDEAIELANRDPAAPTFPGGYLDGGELGLAQALSQSVNQGVRGARAVFVDEDNCVILVGTSVAYGNSRHFTSDFRDPLLQALYDQVNETTDDLTDDATFSSPYGSATADATDGTVPVDLAELARIAAALRQRAKVKIGDAIFDRAQGADAELIDYAERLERQVLAAGGSLGGAKSQAKDAVDELRQGVEDLVQQAREKIGIGAARFQKFLRDLDKNGK